MFMAKIKITQINLFTLHLLLMYLDMSQIVVTGLL